MIPFQVTLKIHILAFLASLLLPLGLNCLISCLLLGVSKKAKKRRRNMIIGNRHAMLKSYCSLPSLILDLFFVGLYDYFSQPFPTGSPTCGFMFTMSLPLYKPLALPLWRTLETMIPYFVEEKGNMPAFLVIFFFFGVIFAPIFIALSFFVLPLAIVFIPATLVTFLLLIGLYLLVGCFLLPCAGGASVFRADKLGDFCNSLPGRLLKVGTFVILGWLIYFSALYGSFYHGTSWSTLWNHSKNYFDISGVFVWPSDISFGGQAAVGAGAASAVTQSLAQILEKLDWWSEKCQTVSTMGVDNVNAVKKAATKAKKSKKGDEEEGTVGHD